MKPEYQAATFCLEQPDRRWPNKFAVFTAYNPKGKKLSDPENEKKDRQLWEDLKSRNLCAVRIHGCTPDCPDIEPGYVVELPFKDAVALAAKFRQEAFFWVEGDSLFLVDVATQTTSLAGSWRARLKKGLESGLSASRRSSVR